MSRGRGTAPSSLNGARNRKPPCAGLEVPSGTAMEERRRGWISPLSITTATLAALPQSSSPPPWRICSFAKLKEGGRDLEIAGGPTLSTDYHITSCLCNMDPGLAGSAGNCTFSNFPNCSVISADLQDGQRVLPVLYF